MKCIYRVLFTTVLVGFLFNQNAIAEKKSRIAPQPAREYASEKDRRWSDLHGPWNFSGMIGLFSPGTGIQGLAGYRILDTVVRDLDDSLVFETGLGLIYITEAFPTQTVTYTAFEIPFMARWDIRLPNSKFIAGPRAGFDYITGGTVVVDGRTYTTRGGSLYLQVGGDAFYQVNDKWWIRLSLGLGSYTSVKFGVTYFD